jgi:membrane-bound lytic murein transglycosylase D
MTRASSHLVPLVCLLAAAALAGCSLRPAHPRAADGEPLAALRPVEPVVVPPARLALEEPGLESLPAMPPDVIGRLRAGFALPVVDDAAVAAELDWYGGHPDYIARVFDRARLYLRYIADRLDERGMPADLALLPVVESAFDPFAYSRGRASGLWQIIPGTGKRLGLKQNWWYDGRRDVVDSTRAALDYLQALHEQFGGDWLLAIAGYNSGEGNVARAIRKAKAAGRATDFWSIRKDLPPETARYVPKLLAIRDLVAEPEAYGLELPTIEDEPYFATVETDGQIDIALAADLGGLSVDALYELNPGINRWATDPDGPYRLFVPAADAGVFTEALASLDATERVRWTRHEITRGETLIDIADKYATTPDVLRAINGISGSMIRAGDFLMIPHPSAGAGAYSLSVEARTARQQDRERDGTRVDYAVRPGDSLWSIAQRYGVGTNELASWNAMAPGDVLSVGRRLVVWQQGQKRGQSPFSAKKGSDPFSASSVPSQIRRINYVVRRGDSLSSIAGRFKVSLGELLDWNSLSPDKYLQPGQALVLYVDVAEQSS